MKTKLNDQAFPGKYMIYDEYGDPMYGYDIGLTKREYFAALAMQGLSTPLVPGVQNLNRMDEAIHKAGMAVRLADALIEELNKKKE